MLELVVTETQAGRTVRSLLKGELGLSTARVNRLKRLDGGLTLNGRRVYTNAVVSEGDRLAAADEALEHPSRAEPVPMELSVAYEDGCLLVVDKPAPLAVAASSLSPGEATLANGMAYYLGPGAGYHPVNRLDRGTTGLMVVAKSGYIHDRLRRELHSGGFFRQYLAVCVGTPSPAQGEILLPIGRAPGSALRRQAGPGGQDARTSYRVLGVRGKFSLVELTPATGRTHQLRVHMSAIGCPLAGDWLYGEEAPDLIARPALHSARLEMTHPVTGQRVILTSPLPEDMKLLWER